MDFRLSEDQRAMRTEVRRYLDRRFTPERVAQLADSEAGWDPVSWQELADMGWLGIDVPEHLGGAGLGFVEVAIVLEQLARVVYPGPYFSTVVLAMPGLSDNDVRAAVEGSARWSAEVDGVVPDLAIVDRVLVGEGAVDAIGVELDTSDATRRHGRLAPDLQVTPAGTMDLTRVHAGIAAEAVGVAQRALDLAVIHAQQREQFGRPIGAFQGVSHSIAYCYGEVELSRSLMLWAAWCIDSAPDQAAVAAAAAASHAAETAVEVCERAIQVHGGIAFTWEHELHRGYKRALGLQALTGYPAQQRKIVAEMLFDASGDRNF